MRSDMQCVWTPLWAPLVLEKVNGCEALTMVDTGSTTNFISPAFATVAKLAAFTLESQLALQLGCVGS